MYRRILFPTDGSDGARAALDHALDLADRHDATLHVLNVVSDARWTMVGDEGGMSGVDVGAIQENLEKRGTGIVEEAATAAADHDVDCVTDVVTGGPPHRAILEYVDENDVDLVVMGTHGRRGFDRLLMGSVAEKVVRSSSVPVLTVKMDDPGAVEE
ncbi:universal stress protein [Halomarina litorea]|uniref:universal stress protein n=1 Tax=Halomarina litorea TaxID=2961595 RepID=UPI0020C57EFD|nr:universal stress protein [Halomarina sp. BCD28]